jgi:hypothetical protein
LAQKTYRKADGLSQRGSIWYLKMKVPADVQAVIGKKVLSRNLNTPNLRHAQAEGARVRAEWWALIHAARSGPSIDDIRRVVADWKAGQDRSRHLRPDRRSILLSHGIDPADTDQDADAVESLTRSMYLAARGDDPPHSLMAALKASGLDDTPEARRLMGKALLEIEYSKRLNGEAHLAATKAAGFEAKTFGAVGPVATVRLTGTRLSALFDDFNRHNPANAKETGKRRGYVKRLTEFLGEDSDIGTITIRQAHDFWLALKRLPAQRRSKALARLNFAELVELDLPAIGDQALFQWLLFFRRLFEHAVQFEIISMNPFRSIKLKLDKSELAGEAYTPEAIERLFQSPLFTGHDGAYDRCMPGSTVIKDWRYWLPILSLWTGTRLNEWASAAKAEIVKKDEGWFLDLTQRPVGGEAPNRVKTKAARRLVPIHQRLIELGFLEFAEAQSGPWLFADLWGHKLHPSARAANWFTRYREKIGFDNTIHDLRHTWKRAARPRGETQSGMTEEISDLITAHVSGSIGRKYGAGVEPAALTKAIEMIDFPTFPLR